MIHGLIDSKIQQYYTYLGPVFEAIGQIQTQYNWLITDFECYPNDPQIQQVLDREYCWLSGEELTELVRKDDCQWIWGVLCAFEKEVSREDVLQYPLPSAIDYNGYYRNPIAMQHPLAIMEIVPSDSSWVLLLSKDKTITDRYRAAYPKVEDLAHYNAAP